MQWRPCRRHSCWNSGLVLWKIRVGNTCGFTFHNHFVLCGNFCDCRCNGAMTTPLFRQRKLCHQPDPTAMRLLLRAPGSATPTPTVHAIFRCTRWLSTFHRGARPVFTRPSWSERERDLSSKPLSFSKERMRERVDIDTICFFFQHIMLFIMLFFCSNYAKIYAFCPTLC